MFENNYRTVPKEIQLLIRFKRDSKIHDAVTRGSAVPAESAWWRTCVHALSYIGFPSHVITIRKAALEFGTLAESGSHY